ncbi:MAG: hypothetical protein ACXABY_32590 [Candidatus Thorarchaeota archaeon]|jgi:hypothetical protein
MGWLKNLFSKQDTPPEPSARVAPQSLAWEPRREAFVELRKMEEKSTATPGMATQQKIAGIKRIKSRVLSYAQSRYRGIVVEDVESFVRQATYKKVALMYKEGFDFAGKDPQALTYVETRLAQIAHASNISTGELLRNIGSSLIRMSNSFLVKKRDESASGGGTRKTPEGKTLKPVAGYFPVPAETMRVKLDKSGSVAGWRQEMPDGQYKRRKDGFIFGTPDLIPVLDDIRALRNIEETIELLLHKHLFPLFQYIVGTEDHPAGVTEDGQDEIEVAKREIEYMPAEGGIVTPERHKIEAIGAEGRALRGEGYLTHFKRRVIAGLGVSIIDLGEADSANRATARTLSRQLIDTVKDIQDALEEQFYREVVSELLLESTFDFDVLAANHAVGLQFREIDIENRIEQEKHSAEMFEANGLTYPEFRIALGKEPIEIPEDPNDQDPKKYPGWHQTHWKLFGEPENIIRAIDEAWTLQAKAAAQARSTSLTQGDLATSQKEQEEKERRAAEEDRKTKVAVAKAKPKPTSTTKNSIEDAIRSFAGYKELEREIVQYISVILEEEGDQFDPHTVMQNVQTQLLFWANGYSDDLSSVAMSGFVSKFNQKSGGRASQAFTRVAVAREDIHDRCIHYSNKLATDLTTGISKALVEHLSSDDPTSKTAASLLVASLRSVFAAHQYRLRFLEHTEVKKAKSYGMLLGMQHVGINRVKYLADDDACERCLAAADAIYHPDEIDLESIVPVHPGCHCQILPIEEE